MKYIVEAKALKVSASCTSFCLIKCDRVGKCEAKQR